MDHLPETFRDRMRTIKRYANEALKLDRMISDLEWILPMGIDTNPDYESGDLGNNPKGVNKSDVQEWLVRETRCRIASIVSTAKQS